MGADPPGDAAPHQMTFARRRTEWRGNCTNTVMTELVANDSVHSTFNPPSEMSVAVPPHILASVPKRTGSRRAMRGLPLRLSWSAVAMGPPRRPNLMRLARRCQPSDRDPDGSGAPLRAGARPGGAARVT